MGYKVQKIPEGDEYVESTSALSDAIDDWLSKTSGINIISINTVFASDSATIRQAAIITYTTTGDQIRD